MIETLSTKEGALKVYEIGYLLVSSVPAEKVADIAISLKDVLSKKGAGIISEEAPEFIELSYTMIKKIGTTNQRFDRGYFGWIKFDLSSAEIEEVKKAFEMHPDMLRMLVIITVRENTFLGKKVPTVAMEGVSPEVPANETLPIPGLENKTEEKADEKASSVASSKVSIEDMDKSIDEMVKEA